MRMKVYLSFLRLLTVMLMKRRSADHTVPRRELEKWLVTSR